MAKVTIENISRETGLSRGTVSRALNDRPDISEATKQRVLDACRQLKYVPSHAARSLATGRRYAVAVAVDDLRTSFATRFLRGVLTRARAERYAVHVSELNAEGAGAVEHLCALVSERVDFLLLAAPLPTDFIRPVMDSLIDRPLVAVAPVEGVPCDVLSPDQMESGRLTARHLLPTGDFLYVHRMGSVAAEQRRNGFHEVCRGAGVDPQACTADVIMGDSGAAGALESIRPRLAQVRAVAASDDFLAIDVAMLCCQLGRVPGRDIAVMGQGNEPVGEQIEPTLTTTDCCAEEIGQRAMEIALQRLAKARQDAPQQTYVPPILIARASTRLLQ